MALSAPAQAALQSLDDDTLATLHAQDGIRVELGDTADSAMTQLNWITDKGAAAFGACTGGVANQHACTRINNLSLAGSGGPLRFRTDLDVASNALTGGNPGALLRFEWDPMLMVFGGITLTTPTIDYSARSLGSIGFKSQGYISLFNVGGPFNSGNTAQLDMSVTGDIIYRQGGATSPEVSFGNFQFINRFSNGAAGGQLSSIGRVGVDNQGLIVSSAFSDTRLLFDIMYKGSPTNFDLTGRDSITLFGWTGGLVNPTFRINAGGVAYGTYATTLNNFSGVSRTYYDYTGTNGGGARSQGLNLTASWDFDTDFSFVMGQAGGNRTQVRFSNWRRMGASASPMLLMPLTFDIMQNNTGPLGLCFGGGFTAGTPVQASCTAEAGGNWIAAGVPATKAAFATHIRDGRLWAYNQSVEVFDPTSILPYSTYRWSLLYTFGKLDADIYMYPEGRAPGVPVTTTTTGLKSDITLTAQSPGYWDQANGSAAQRAALYTTGAGSRWATNTHFMLADTAVGGNTAVQYGVGLVNADLLWRTRDMYIRAVYADSGYPDLPGGLWLQTDTLAQYRFRGLFGGGNLLNLTAPSPLALMDLNLQANRFIFVLHPVAPTAGDAPIGFAGILDLDGTSYLSLGEVSSPNSTFRLYNVGGRIGWSKGRVNLVSGQNNPPTNLPKLSISNDLLFGASAGFGGAAGAPLLGSTGFGNEYFGRIVLPAGQWNSDITIKIPGT